jgi:hypothetical protein
MGITVSLSPARSDSVGSWRTSPRSGENHRAAGLGANLTAGRQQLTRLLQGYHGEDEPANFPSRESAVAIWVAIHHHYGAWLPAPWDVMHQLAIELRKHILKVDMAAEVTGRVCASCWAWACGAV